MTTTNLKYTTVEISAVVALSERPVLVPAEGEFIWVADCRFSHDFEQDHHGQIIPLRKKQCFVKKVAKNGSFFANGR